MRKTAFLLLFAAFSCGFAAFDLSLIVCQPCGSLDGCCAEVCSAEQYSADPDCSQPPSFCSSNGVCEAGCTSDPDCTSCPDCVICPADRLDCCEGVSCPSGQTCISGECNDCSAGNSCNLHCDGYDPDCACTIDSDCPQGASCVDNSCVICSGDSFCNPFCLQGMDPDCGGGGGGGTCSSNGVCEAGCTSDPDCTSCPDCVICPADRLDCCEGVSCPSGQTCISGECNDCSAGNSCNLHCDGYDPDCACTIDSDCPPGAVCISGSCVVCSLEDSFCNPFCLQGTDPDCYGDEACIPSCTADFECIGGSCISCEADSVCVSQCSDDPDCCELDADCSAGKVCEDGTCILPGCTSDGVCNAGCENDEDCCMADGTCPSPGCVRGADQDCCLPGDGCNELCAIGDPDCGGGGGGGVCTACSPDGMCNICCTSDADCPPSECSASSECGAAERCVNRRCVYTPYTVQNGTSGNLTFIIIDAPALAELGSLIQLNVTFLDGDAAPRVLIYVHYPDGSVAQVLTDQLGHALFNASMEGEYYYDAYGVRVYRGVLTVVQAGMLGEPTEFTYYSDAFPDGKKSISVSVDLVEPSALTLTVSDEAERGVPSSLRIRTPEAEVEDETDESGIFKEDYSELGRYVFTATAKRSVGKLYAKVELERAAAELKLEDNLGVLVFILVLILASALAYYFRKSLYALLSFGRPAHVTISPQNPVAGKEAEIILEAGKKPLAKAHFVLVFRETGEMYDMVTDEEGRTFFIPQQKGRYEIQVPGHSLGGDREFSVG